MPSARRVAAPATRFGSRVVAALACTAALLTAWSLDAPAGEAIAEASDPALEARMVAITSELRCLVCQNQTIADSNAGLAVDLRRETRALLKAGKSDRDVLDYMTSRYGDFVLYRPPLKAATVLLWFGPIGMLLLGAGILVGLLRRRGRMANDAFEADLDDDEASSGAHLAPQASAASAAASSAAQVPVSTGQRV